MLNFFNFDVKWSKWIMECVSSASATVLVNGSPSGGFKMERGLRQGDPLSPFLYLLIAEALSILVSRAVESDASKAIEIGDHNIQVSHLQYADDTIFMCNASPANIMSIKRILKNFELLSGLKVNFQKCNLMGINIDRDCLEASASYLGCTVGEIPFSFLGVKVGISNRKAAEWSDLIQKMRNK